VQRSAKALGGYLPGHEVAEVSNKLEAFRLFAYVEQELGFPPTLPSLPDLVRLAEPLPPLQRSFALEGIAHYYANNVAPENFEGGLLADPALPETAMVPMHAGMGISFATAALADLGLSPSSAELHDVLGGFIQRCHEHSRPGWHNSAIEAMGLTVRTLHPHLRMPVSEALSEIDPSAQLLFWHGVGRSLYFIPKNFLTFGGSHERALESAIDEAPTPECCSNAVAGLVWAVTLVNIKCPGIVENLLQKCGPFQMPLAFTNGVVSALMVWKHMVPDGEGVLAPYLQGISLGGIHFGRWNDLIAEPAREAFVETFPVLTAPLVPGQPPAGTPTIADLFQYHETGMNPHLSLGS